MKGLMALSIIIVGLAFMACSDKSSEPEYVGTSTFPLSTDSRWEYDGTIEITSFGDSVTVDSEFHVVYRHVIGPDTVVEGIQLMAVEDSLLRADSINQNPEVTRHLYSIYDGRLLEFGQIGILPGGDEYPTYFYPPHIILDLPITPHKSWIESIGNGLFVENEMVGVQYIRAADTDVKCDVIESQLKNNFGHVYSETRYWYSNNGLMRKEKETIEFPENSAAVWVDSLRRLEVMELVNMEIQGY